MFEWARKVTPMYAERELQHKRFSLKKITFDQTPSDISDLALFFLAGTVILDERMLVALYARSEMAQKMIIEHIAPHFKDVKVVYVENEIEVIQMQFLKSESADLFNKSTSELMTIIKDLYRTTDMSVWKAGEKRELGFYAVDKEQLDNQSLFIFPELQSFITEAYLESNESLILIPTGWSFHDDLRHSIFLNFITLIIPAVTLLVDENTSEVVALKLSRAS
ncbi:hypothetical protein FE782_19030 [Paenibacillus antri]|uniref:Uncharacterized protein n=1 Tax=Paenibacillus antri TaxID=2582848 RepID=A0A5R9G9M9_9BACL|nr:hypothetical protein [Paenibacillus antri]TLS50790.1 hypothetical protein FE782_19030 [Paenibacillus antri]